VVERVFLQTKQTLPGRIQAFIAFVTHGSPTSLGLHAQMERWIRTHMVNIHNYDTASSDPCEGGRQAQPSVLFPGSGFHHFGPW
jgi:hypothetical protein